MPPLYVQQVPPFDCIASTVTSMPHCLEDSNRLVNVTEAVLYTEQSCPEHVPLDCIVCQTSGQVNGEHQPSIHDRHRQLTE